MTVLALHIDSPELVLGQAARRAILDPLIRLVEAQQNPLQNYSGGLQCKQG